MHVTWEHIISYLVCLDALFVHLLEETEHLRTRKQHTCVDCVMPRPTLTDRTHTLTHTDCWRYTYVIGVRRTVPHSAFCVPFPFIFFLSFESSCIGLSTFVTTG